MITLRLPRAVLLASALSLSPALASAQQPETQAPSEPAASSPPAPAESSAVADVATSTATATVVIVTPKRKPSSGKSAVFAASGLHTSITRVRGADRDDQGWGLTLWGDGESYHTTEEVTGRSSFHYAIGGGSSGFEGALETSAAMGARLRLGDDHGPLARVGFSGWLWGNGLLYQSLIEVPEFQIAYQWLGSSSLIELGVRFGPVLVGRFNVGEGSSRRLGGSLEYGGYGSIHLNPVHLHGSVMRVDANNTGTGGNVDIARVTLCGTPGPFSLCGDANLLRGDVAPGKGGLPSEATASYVGILVGVLVPPN